MKISSILVFLEMLLEDRRRSTARVLGARERHLRCARVSRRYCVQSTQRKHWKHTSLSGTKFRASGWTSNWSLYSQGFYVISKLIVPRFPGVSNAALGNYVSIFWSAAALGWSKTTWKLTHFQSWMHFWIFQFSKYSQIWAFAAEYLKVML